MSRSIAPKRDTPKPGQESVWDYPRPAKLEPTSRTLEVFFGGERIAHTTRGFRTLETSHPPTYYFPPEDVRMEFLAPGDGASFCEWKGQAAYYHVSCNGQTRTNAAWTYTNPSPSFAPIAGYIAFYPWAMEECRVDGETARPQEGEFYGGWITNDLAGPFKGAPGTRGW